MAAEPAYACENEIKAPWTKGTLRGENGVYCDAFNYWLSSYRMNLEQAFGVLLNRWCILERLLSFNIPVSLLIFTVFLRLHKFSIQEDGIQRIDEFEQSDESESAAYNFKNCWNNSPSLWKDRLNSRNRHHLEVYAIRHALKNCLRDRGLTKSR